VADVVFSCGLTVGDDGDTIYLYYGAAAIAIRCARPWEAGIGR
jgi:predicted GH43/DUF377 family glycosyl hydrolase